MSKEEKNITGSKRKRDDDEEDEKKEEKEEENTEPAQKKIKLDEPKVKEETELETEFKILVKSITGIRRYPMTVSKSTTIIEVKVEVNKQMKDADIGPERQRLLLSGKELKDEKTIGDYPNIEDGTEIFVIFRIRGTALGQKVRRNIKAFNLLHK